MIESGANELHNLDRDKYKSIMGIFILKPAEFEKGACWEMLQIRLANS